MISSGQMVPKYPAIISHSAGILREAGNNLPRSIAAAARLTKGPRSLVNHFQPVKAGNMNLHSAYLAYGLGLAGSAASVNASASGSEGREGVCGLG